jgi:tetratricopeptide (TPR) repeat protein
MINNNKLTGVGAGNWGVAVMKHDVTSIRDNDAGKTFFQRAHNDYLQQGAEGGYPGMIIFLTLFFVSGYAVFKTVSRKNPCCTVGEKGVILFVWVSIVIFSAFSFPYERPLLQMIIMAFFAGIISLCKFKISFKKVRIYWMKRIMAILVVPLLLLVCFYAKKLNSEILTYRMYKARAQRDYVTQEKLAIAAISFNHQLDKTSTPIAWYAGEACVNQHDYLKAYQWYELAYHHNQYHPYVLNNYAWTLWFFHQEEAAKTLFKQVILFNPKFDEARLNYISLCFEEGDYYEAVHHLQLVDTLCRNEKYRIAVDLILPAVARKTRQSIDEPGIEFAIQRIESDERWMKKVFLQSINDQNSFTKQLLTEAVYLIYVVDKDISTSEALDLKRKYTIE